MSWHVPSRSGRLTDASAASRFAHRPCFAVLLLSVLLLTSCGRPTGVVSGKITCNNRPLSLGTVAMIDEDGKVASGMISDGEYKIENAPVGPVKISVQVYPPSPMMHPPTGPEAGAKPKPRLVFIPIPDRYKDASSSGLTYTVVSGEQTHDLELSPR